MPFKNLSYLTGGLSFILKFLWKEHKTKKPIPATVYIYYNSALLALGVVLWYYLIADDEDTETHQTTKRPPT
jgi:hypothetical protein